VCRQLIVVTQLDLAGVTITGRNASRDRAQLENKLKEALAKLDVGVLDGAIGKLIGFRGKVLDLLSAKKISQADANLLIDDVDAAISCLDDLI